MWPPCELSSVYVLVQLLPCLVVTKFELNFSKSFKKMFSLLWTEHFPIRTKVIKIQNYLSQNALQEIAALFMATYKISKLSSDFKNSKTKMCFRQFKATLSFWPPDTLPENEITPDLTWYKLGVKKKNHLLSFCQQKVLSPEQKSHPNSKLFEPKYIVGDPKQLSFSG